MLKPSEYAKTHRAAGEHGENDPQACHSPAASSLRSQAQQSATGTSSVYGALDTMQGVAGAERDACCDPVVRNLEPVKILFAYGL